MADADYQRLAELVIEGDGEGAKALTERLIGEGVAGREVLDRGRISL